jgi:predicted RNA-binding Zn-ribbon protein involved in translation (DUF1610 family)
MAKQMSCPACGAPLTIESRFVKLVTCDFCGQVSLLRDTGLDPTGRTAKLATFPSPLYIDATGTLQGHRFRVMGRLRYRYDAGFWDEWFLTFDNGKPGWLTEDEGEFSFYVKSSFEGQLPSFEEVRVGGTLTVAGRRVFVTEKGHAEIAGGEGQLAFTLLPGEPVDYVDGTSDDRLVSIEYAEDEIEVSLGRAVDRDELVIDEEDYG